jgi:hypothetical protein
MVIRFGYGQEYDVVTITLDGETTAYETPREERMLSRIQTNYVDEEERYVSFISYVNPSNNSKAQKEWEILNGLFETNNIGLGITMCSLSCMCTIRESDYAQGVRLVRDAINNGLINNSIINVQIREKDD